MGVSARAAGLLLGYAADLVFGDPVRGHPVAGFGRVARTVERATYADGKVGGATHAVLLVGTTAGLGYVAERAARRSPLAEAALVGVATWTVLGGRSLTREAEAMTGLLTAGDLPEARRRLSHLCARDAGGLDARALARASVESLGENTSDAVVAPLVWGAVGGVPGLLGYRALNTLDAMVGYRSHRYARFGWASARADDVANWVPARISALLTAWVGGRAKRSLRVWRRDAGAHPSPNAGPVEAAFAGALGVRLGGRNAYAGQVEDRGVLDGGREVEVGDLIRASELSVRVGAAGAAVAAALAVGVELLGARNGRRRG